MLMAQAVRLADFPAWPFIVLARLGWYVNRDKVQLIISDDDCARVVLTTVEVVVCRDGQVYWRMLDLGG